MQDGIELGYFDRYKVMDTERTFAEVNEQHFIDFNREIETMTKLYGTCRVLDIGCGNSSFANELWVHNPEAQIVTTDIATDQARDFTPETERAPGVMFVCSDGNALPFSNQSFDMVIATWSVNAYLDQDFPNLERTYIEEIGRILKPGGLASLRPEASWFAYQSINRFTKFSEASIHFPSIGRKAMGYLALRELGFDVRFMDEPNRARIYGPEHPSHTANLAKNREFAS